MNSISKSRTTSSRFETKDLDKLSRVQDILSQKLKRHVSREEALAMMLEFYLEKNDPVRKAERLAPSEESFASEPSPTTLPRAELAAPSRHLPLKIKPQVITRDQGQCTFVHIDIHHHVPVSRGGQNTVENLVTLCKAHHQWVHRVAKA